MGFFSDIKLSLKFSPMTAEIDAGIRRLERMLGSQDYLSIIDYLPAADLMIKKHHETFIRLRGEYGVEALEIPSQRYARYLDRMCSLMMQAEKTVAPLREALQSE